MPTSQNFETAYKTLNKEQKRAVDTIDGPLMVIAGPGTGKTQVLSLRVGNILQKTDIAPGNILCLTFTDAAAVNMRERLSALIGPASYRVAIHTFHSFAREVIATYPEYFYNGADFVAADDLAQLEILEAIFTELPRKDPLASKHEDEFTYLSDAQRSISLLKQAGITPEEFSAVLDRNAKELETVNAGLASVFDERLGKGSAEKVAKLIEKIAKDAKERKEGEVPSLAHMIAVSLGHALKDAHESQKTAPLSAWKQKWTRTDEKDQRVHKDALYIDKMRSLAKVYKSYRLRMQAERYYDFDDMLLDTVLALREYPALLSGLQERYHYILVDEFQDTNDAQLKLVRLLGNAAVNEGKPNIMIVGDDDQAIYRFQGAEISNILDFPKNYPEAALVVLTKNYRSTQEILDVAREVIEKSEERLSTVLPTLEKNLVAKNSALDGNIRHAVLATRTHEHAWVAREISELIESGRDPRDIAVITRRHRELEDIARVLVAANIPITYERKQNVFEEPHIRALVTLARFIVSIVRHKDREADEFLPEILSAPYWGFTREDIWRISLAASNRDDRSWLGAMTDDSNKDIAALGRWLIELGVRAPHEPLERMLDEMIGSDSVLLPIASDDPHEESVKGNPRTTLIQHSRAALKNLKGPPLDSTKFKSPFRTHYFGPDARKKAEARYLMFLSSLRVFVGALREYKHGKPLSILDLVEFADLHERNQIKLADTTPFASAERAVQLLTAHKAKGLEFDTVFVASAAEEVWAGRGYPNKLPFPMNLPIERDEGGDDRLRIFYVALTRAKRALYVTTYKQDDSGKSSIKTSFIAPENADGAIAKHLKEEESAVPDAALLSSMEIMPTHPEFFPIIPGERAILLALIKDYQMSVTHLNNFLDVARAGPAAFLEQNLLRFPTAMTPSAAYGDAMHKAIERFYREFKRTEVLPSCADLLAFFGEWMEKERMTESERAHFLRAGEEALPVWYEESGKHADASHMSEVNFKNQGVEIDGVPIIGKIDKMVVSDSKGSLWIPDADNPKTPFGNNDSSPITVYDFKTGKAKPDWDGKDTREKVLLHGYKRQLTFYKLLVENSHDWSEHKVERGVLEFLEPIDGKIKTLDLEITDEDTKRLAKLIKAVHTRIQNLDFPDTEKYSKDLKGILEFEEELMTGT